MWNAFIIACAVGTNLFAPACNPPIQNGVEIRFMEPLGPYGTSEAECIGYANEQRKRVAAELKLASYMLIKPTCVWVD